MRRFRYDKRKLYSNWLLPTALVLLIAAIGSYLLFQSHAATPGVSVSGNLLYKDGQPFIVRGFTMVGLLSPPGCNQGVGTTAFNHLNQTEMNAAKNVWKANTLRFQVSENGLSGSGFAAGEPAQYLDRIKTGVQLARSNGFVVILSLQDQSISCGPARPLPVPESVAVWQNLANTFKSDPYIMFELWNEPNNGPATSRPATTSPGYDTTLTWPDWLNGRTTAIKPTSGENWSPYIPVGHQQLVNAIRATGATNVLIGNGANKGEHLENMPMLNDNLSPAQIAYSPHFYYFQTSVTDWNTRFGYLAATKPLIITEWNMNCGDAKQASMAQQFLDYVKSKNIGITPWGFDFMNTLISDWNYTPTSASNCSNKSGGLITKNYFNSFPDPGSTDNPPTVSLTAPAASTTVSGASVTVSANAADDKQVASVAFSYKAASASTWTTLGATDTAAPYNVTWNTSSLANGSYDLRAIATDSAGQTTTSSTVTVTVNNVVTPPPDTTKPVTAIVDPTDGATINLVGAMVSVTATATDNVGVTKVELYADSVLVGTTTSAPYTFNWNTKGTTLGTHTLLTKAYDAAGNVGPSTAISVTLTEQTPPTTPVPGDANGDGKVDALDFIALETHFGQNYPPADFNGDGTVTAADLAILLSNWTWQ